MTSSPVSASTASVRRAELIAALSLALDLATGVPLERSLRSCLVGQSLAAAMGFSDEQRSDAYYVSLLHWLGCTADSDEAARVFGDERAVGEWIQPVIGDGPFAVISAMLANHGRGEAIPQRAAMLFRAFTGMPAVMNGMQAHCEVAKALAAHMGFNDRVQVQLGQVYETWNGAGMPNHLKGDQIDPVVRLVNFGEDMQLFHRLGGVEAAVTVAKRRAGKAYDPQVASVFLREPDTFLAPLDEGGGWDRILAHEPEPRIVLAGSDLDDSLLAIADFVNLKVAATSGHSRVVASLARRAGALLGMTDSDQERLQRAAWLHEVGIVSISTAVVEKEARLTESEWERFRLHPYYTERVFANQPYLADLATLASLHHERIDGSGYHRGAAAAGQPMAARVLAAACAYHLAIVGQPGSAALPPAEAAAALREDAGNGRLDPQAVMAVLEAAGQHALRPAASTRPAGLSEREVEVLRLMTGGLSRKQIGAALFIADKTVARHIENIYAKIGVNTRPGAAVFAMQNGLMD